MVASLLAATHLPPKASATTVSEVVITEPVSVTQYPDALAIYLHGFDLLRARHPDLQLEVRPLMPDGSFGTTNVLNLTEPWEKPGILLRKNQTGYAAVLVSARGGGEVIFQRLYQLAGPVEAPTLVPTLAQNSAIELGQFLSEAPVIPLPDRSQFGLPSIGAAQRIVNIDTGSMQVTSDINYPQVSSGQLCALSRQTDFPADESKRSLYVPLKSQLYNQLTGQPAGVAHYLCEVPLDPDWLNGTEDLAVSLSADQIKVHRSDLTDGGTNILGGGGGGLGQGTGTMDVDADGNIYFSNSVPTDVVRFNVSTATFQVPPTDLLPLSNLYLPTDDDILGNGDTSKKNGRWQTYRMVASMNHSEPKRMLYGRTISRLIFNGTLYEWSALFTLPKDHWDDPVAFAEEFRLLVGSWPSAQHSFYDTLPVTDGPNRRIQYFRSYGNSVYAKPYPGSVGGPWRVDIASDNTVEAFGTDAAEDFGASFDDAKSKPHDTKPYNAAGKISFRDYGLLTMERKDLSYCLTGTTDNSLTGLIEVNYDAIAHMLENAVAFAPILDNLGGPSLAPSYLSTSLPGQHGKVLGVGEYGYYLAEFDVNGTTPGEAGKEFLTLDSPDPDVDLPIAVGLGPYGHQWAKLDGDDWLYVSGYTGLTRMQYSEGGVPLGRYTMDKFDNRLSTVNLDAAGHGAIKRFRYLQHGLDGRMFLTGTHTAARAGTAYSGGLLSFHKTELDTLWRLSYMSRSFWTMRLQNRVLRDFDGIPVQEFCATSFFDPEYANTIPDELVPVDHDPKVFLWDYKSGGEMRDLMGYSQPSLDGSFGLNDIAFSRDRRYIITRQGTQLLTFDPQAKRFVDGKNLPFGQDVKLTHFQRPGRDFTRAPDDRLFLYLRESETATRGVFLEIKVSPEGALSFEPFLELQSSSLALIDDTFAAQHTYLPDLANDDGSCDLFLGQQLSTSGGGTTCRVIEDFVPPRRHEFGRSLNVLSNGAGSVAIAGAKPGVTPYRAACEDAETVTLIAPTSTGYAFREWRDESGGVLGTDPSLQLDMDADRTVTAVFGLASPDPANLVVSEIQYRPTAASADEISAGYSLREQFEFIELMNSGQNALDLSEVSFDAGIDFDFSTSPIQSLAPGERVLVVADLGAFVARYGSESAARVAGEYSGELGDGGELVTLSAAGSTIQSFRYDEQPPWPELPSGGGISIVLVAPGRQPPPDHNDAFNWRPSVAVGGSPGESDACQFGAWRVDHGLDGQGADLDLDGRLEIVEYLQDTDPRSTDAVKGMTAGIEMLEVGGTTAPYLVIRVLHKIGADDLDLGIEGTSDLNTWSAWPSEFLGREREGTSAVEWLVFRSETPVDLGSTLFARLRVQER